MSELKTLELADIYDFSVTVDVGENLFAAKLHLSPQKITLTIMGENSKSRTCDIAWEGVERLVCRDFKNTFFLHNLKLYSGNTQFLHHAHQSVAFFEKCFEVEFAIFHPSHASVGDGVSFISMDAKQINEWIGNTRKQEEIIEAYYTKKLYEADTREFVVPVGDIGALGVLYNVSMHHSSPDFNAGILFPPSLFIHFCIPQVTNEVMNSFLKLYTLIAFFIGNDFLVERVNVAFNSPIVGATGSLYYPSLQYKPKYERDYSFYPLGVNLRFNSLGLPSLPFDSFNQYYELSDAEASYYQKFLQYKRMDSLEERFLGFFRLLESLVYKKKSFLDEKILEEVCKRAKPYLNKKFSDAKNVSRFLRGINRYNNSKYNTEKCIKDFYSRIPSSTTKEWKLQNIDIGDICQLRNDITHANHYYINDKDLARRVKFIEVLLIFALYEKLGVNISVTAEIIDRVQGYHWIQMDIKDLL